MAFPDIYFLILIKKIIIINRITYVYFLHCVSCLINPVQAAVYSQANNIYNYTNTVRFINYYDYNNQ